MQIFCLLPTHKTFPLVLKGNLKKISGEKKLRIVFLILPNFLNDSRYSNRLEVVAKPTWLDFKIDYKIRYELWCL